MDRATIAPPPTTIDKPLSRRGGRPSRDVAAKLQDIILNAATTRFLRDGYAATSMEAIAADAGVSKRTLYARFADKTAVLQTAITHLIDTWLGGFDEAVHQPGLEAALTAAAHRMLAAALTREALALYRLLVAEAPRIPHLPHLLAASGAGAGVVRIATLLAQAGVAEPGFAAEQFQRLIITGPQHRALGFGPPMDAAGLDRWCTQCVKLFLRGALPA